MGIMHGTAERALAYDGVSVRVYVMARVGPYAVVRSGACSAAS